MLFKNREDLRVGDVVLEENVHNNQMGDAATLAVTLEDRREAAKLNNVGKHEPKLTENGIPADVLEKLLASGMTADEILAKLK